MIYSVLSLMIFALILIGCNGKKKDNREESEVSFFPVTESSESILPERSFSDDVGFDSKSILPEGAPSDDAGFEEDTFGLIDPDGTTLESRIRTPEGYMRTEAEEGSLAEYLRTYELKPDQSPVLLYDGTPKGNQDSHVAVFTLPIEEEDLQQCADSVMRVYAEYYWEKGEYDKIRFHFVNGFLAEYEKWREGWRIKVNGSEVSWSKSASFDDSYGCFQSFMRIVFSYAGTLSMAAECGGISLADAAPGDVFLKGGSPGHVVMIVDACVDGSGRKAFLLAQGYMPAQEFHVLKNILHEEDPWYYEDEITYPFVTPEYTFEEGSLCRPEQIEAQEGGKRG
ncbi:MAG TPA: hypothetical protein DF613_08565 [Lachnospiraceae bacterium]|nr:hypothetical protein [Lachnospiraceae bacterium]